MGSQPYIVYTEKRPLRIAFIIDVDSESVWDDLKSIVEYASRKWGGRFYQIIPSKKESVSKEWVDYLVSYDPDVVYTLTALSKTTIKRISLDVHPYSFAKQIHAGNINLSGDPIDVLPSPQNILNLWGYNPHYKPHILELSYDTNISNRTLPSYLKKFLDFNFGRIICGGTQTDLLLSEYNYEKLIITNHQQFKDTMRQIGGQYTHPIDPIALSSLPGVHYQHIRKSDSFNVKLFVGDSPLDLIYFWNEKLLTPNWLSHRKTEIWIPEKLLTDDGLFDSISSWIGKIASFDNSRIHSISLVSSSVNKNTLNKHSRKLTSKRILINGLYASFRADKITSPTIPIYSNRIAITESMKPHSVSGDTFNIILDEVDQLQGGMGGQVWMADVFIRQEDEDERVTPKKEFWLQLPRKNSLASLCIKHDTLHGSAKRVTRQHMPSLVVARKSQFNGEDYLINIEVPTSRDIAAHILCVEPDTMFFADDIRKGAISRRRPFEDFGMSEPGRSLQGFTHLFGNLMESAHFFSNPYWRRVFFTIAGADPLGDSGMGQNLNAWILNHRNDPNCPDDSFISKIKDYAVQLKLESQTKNFDFFESELKEEFTQYNLLHPSETEKYNRNSKQGLLNTLSWLIDIGVLRAGYVHKCRHCSLPKWYSIDDINNIENRCEGCRYPFSIQPEQTMEYSLNSIISRRSIYNQIPVSLALASLHDIATSSFYYIPSLDIYKQYGANPYTDLDIFAIVDGNLIIGEVKNSQTGFKNDDFNKMYEVAIRIRPSKVIVTSMMDKNPDKVNEGRIRELRGRLKSTGIKVEWLSLNSRGFRDVFEVDPGIIWGYTS